eukprot:4593708-Pleurochrysis_carterae.AAC.4
MHAIPFPTAPGATTSVYAHSRLTSPPAQRDRDTEESATGEQILLWCPSGVCAVLTFDSRYRPPVSRPNASTIPGSYVRTLA